MSQVQTLMLLLEHAERERDEAQQALQRAQNELVSAQAQMEQIVGYRRDYEQRYAAQFRQGGAIEVVRHYQSFMQRMNQAVDHQTLVVRQQEQRLPEARALLQERELKVASIRKLIERREDDARRRQDRRDQKATDEAAARAGRDAAGMGSASLFTATVWA